MAAEVRGGDFGFEPPDVDVFADEVFDTAGLAFPGRVFPRAADGGDELEPRHFGGDAIQFFSVSEFPGTASALQAIKLVIAGHGTAAIFPILVDGAHVTDERSDAGDGGKKQMARA